MESSSNFGQWTVSKLKSELRLRGAVTTGRKSDLVERLVYYVIKVSIFDEAVLTVW